MAESFSSFGVSLEAEENQSTLSGDSCVPIERISEQKLRKTLSAEQFELWQKLERCTRQSTPLKKKNQQKSLFQSLKSTLWLSKNVRSLGQIRSILKGLRLLRKSPAYFDKEYYRKKNPDVQSSGLDPLIHFLIKGWREYRNPSPYFDVRHYLIDNPDIKMAGVNPLLHYIDIGWREGRYPSIIQRLESIYAQTEREIDPKTHPLLLIHREDVLPGSAVQVSKRVNFIHTERKFVHLVTVLVPVYLANEEAVRVFSLLLESIKSSYPIEHPLLQFIFIDDCSPLAEMEKCLCRAELLGRSDIQFYANTVNIGFVGTINTGFQFVEKGSDVVILNNDTEIHGSVFEILQDNCLRYPKIASVTPLSNRAVLSSLSSWPLGDDTVYGLQPEQVSLKIETIGLESPNVYVPTGHGFCMYMSNEALNDTGGFDSETFGKGYGEENDWSIRAIRKGYRHLISTECYVHHHESKSFDHDKKAALKKNNLGLLSARYPFYNSWVQYYLHEDPLKLHRKVLQIFLLAEDKLKRGYKTICFVLHDSFKNPGGVQHYVRHLIKEIQQHITMEVIVVAPTELVSDRYEVYCQQGDKNVVIDQIDHRSLIAILEKIEERIDYVHLHNTFGVLDSVLDWIIKLKKSKKILSIHDYQLFCRNPFLLDDNDQFCLTLDERNCGDNRCKSTDGADFLKSFDTVIVPSENCQANIHTLLDNGHKNIALQLLPHFLSYLQDDENYVYVEKASGGKSVVFLGALYIHKGGKQFLEAVPDLVQAGYFPMVWGTVQDELAEKYKQLPPLFPFSNHKDLLELYAKYGADVIVMPSICAETFSYTLYESLFLLEVPVVVGKYGHPADIVKKYGVGEITSQKSNQGIVQAVNQILANIDDYKRRIKSFKQEVISFHRPKAYLEHYFSLLGLKDYEFFSEKTTERIHYRNKSASEYARRIYTAAASEKSKGLSKVVMVHGLTAENPPYFYRVENHSYFLHNSGCQVVQTSLEKLEPSMLEDTDIFYLFRTPLNEKLNQLLAKAKENRITTILDVDDLIFHSSFIKELYFVAGDEEHAGKYRKMLSAMEETFKMADILLGSTPEIAEAGEKLGKTSLYFRNRLLQKQSHIYNSLFKNRPAFKGKVIGYFSGSNTHDIDFLSITNALEEIFNLFPDAELLLMGFVEQSDFIIKHEKRITQLPFGTYEDYLRAIQQCKVVLAPLAQINRFSNAKSNIKFLETASVGTPVIASPCREMVTSIEHGLNGWIAENQKQWVDAIQQSFFEDHGAYVGAVANRYVLHHFGDASEEFYTLLDAI